MKILLIQKDIFYNIGGGQSIYKKIITSNPGIKFYYFIENEKYNISIPRNVIRIKLKSKFKIISNEYSQNDCAIIENINQYARCVKNCNFDFVEFPDYYCFSNLYKQVFEYHNVSVGAYVLSLHGTLTVSKKLNWGSHINETSSIFTDEEIKQFESADFVYGISKFYINEYKKYHNREVYFLNPICFFNKTNYNQINFQKSKPNLVHIGRMERLKGNDIFVELIAWLDKLSFNKLINLGEYDYSLNGISSKSIIKNFANKRSLDIHFENPKSAFQLKQIFESNTIIFITSRFDTLNLVALESIFSGCPTVISDKAGVCNYLDEFFPGLPYVKINTRSLYDSVNDIQILLNRYHEFRISLCSYLNSQNINTNKEISLYNQFINNNNIVKKVKSQNFKVGILDIKHFIFSAFLKLLPDKFFKTLLGIRKNPFFFFKENFTNFSYNHLFSSLISIFRATKSIFNLNKLVFSYNEIPIVDNYKMLYNRYFKRYLFWENLSNFYINKKNYNLFLIYQFRLIRYFPESSIIFRNDIIASLNILNYFNELNLFINLTKGDQNVYDYLLSREESLKYNYFKKFSVLVDNRCEIAPKISIIISLYNASDKLKFFLDAMINQKLINDDKASTEFIFVDSNTPSNEYDVYKNFLEQKYLNSIYIKTEKRETIQSAWNSGISISRGIYLVFLGVDEILYPDALDILSSYLDENDDCDWVMSNSLVTEVDKFGLLINDSFVYKRGNSYKEKTYLDTCNVSWVGGMYRKSIHERFGYYDESFSAAGDTEFKNRILKNINVSFLDKTLGLFLNYPDERATASAKAEIEDFRAWYIFRTPGGIKYLFESYSQEQLVDFLISTLSYKKTYKNRSSTDFYFSFELSKYILNRSFSKKMNIVNNDLSMLIHLLKNINTKNNINSKYLLLTSFLYIFLKVKYYQFKHSILFKRKLNYTIFNDNSYEQHFWIW